MNTLERSKRLGYTEGDLVIGKNRGWISPVYRVTAVNDKAVRLHAHSFNGMLIAEPWARLIFWGTPPTSGEEGLLAPEDFRRATEAEIHESEYVMKRQPWEG